MGRLHISVPLLLLFLILHYATSSSTFQESTTGRFKIGDSAHKSGNTGGSIQTISRKERFEKKVRKTPSGPSPVGNNRPPSKA